MSIEKFYNFFLSPEIFSGLRKEVERGGERSFFVALFTSLSTF
jgi:hypothetical protein